MTTQDNQSELREKLTCIMGGCIGSHENCFYETIEDAEIGSAEETKQMVDMQISLIEAYVTTRVKEALEAARSKDPHKCEFGHEVYSHNTVDGWCCACEADQAFMDGRVKEAERLARMSELEMFKKVPVDKMTKETAEHISRRYKALTTTTNGKEE